MKRIATFHKVSKEKFDKELEAVFPDYTEADKQLVYDEIKLPKRATKGSAGYDFFSSVAFNLRPGETVLVPTGIRVEMEEGWMLSLYPRSGLGFKYRLQLNNTVGIIDSDYFYSDNEGHIMVRLTNDTNEDKMLRVERGDAFIQGIFTEYGITTDDDAQGIRNGGFGSTSE